MDERVLRDVLREELSKISLILLTADIDALDNRIEGFYGHLLRIYDRGLAPSVVNEDVLDIIRKLLHIVQSDHNNSIVSDWRQPTVMSHQRGSPKYDLHGASCCTSLNMVSLVAESVQCLGYHKALFVVECLSMD